MWENSAGDTACVAYADPVGRLLTVGEATVFRRSDWPDYPTLYGLGPEHIPELIHMTCDMTLHTSDWDGLEIWAPVHAWRTLGQLHAAAAIQPLLEFSKVPLDDDAVANEFATVYGMIGPAAIGPITTFLADRTLDWLPASIAAGGLKEIVDRHPECRDECVTILTKALEHAADTNPTTNGFMISNLIDLAAVEAIDAIREAFRLDAVDASIAGDLEEVEIELGLRERRVSPPPKYWSPPAKFVASEASRGASHDDRRLVFDASPRPAKIGRNEPCPCGSGKKYKKCCL
jgi:hypothetical protein